MNEPLTLEEREEYRRLGAKHAAYEEARRLGIQRIKDRLLTPDDPPNYRTGVAIIFNHAVNNADEWVAALQPFTTKDAA